MLHPCPTQFACTGVFDLLSPSLLNACRSDSSRLYPSSLSAAFSESAVSHRLIRVGAARPESAGPIRVSQDVPSRTALSGCEPAPESGPPILPHVPAMMATGRRTTTTRGSEATEPSLGVGGGPAPEAPCRTPRGAAVRRGFDSRGRPRVVLGLSTRAVDPEVPPSVGACMEARVVYV